MRLEDGLVRASELVPERLEERLAERVEQHEARRVHEARVAHILEDIARKPVVVRTEAHFDYDSDAVISAEPAVDARSLAEATRAAPCVVVVQVERVDYGWRDLGLGTAAAIRGWARGGDLEPNKGCAAPGDTLAIVLPGGWFEWEGVPFHSQMWLGLRRPVEGDTILVLGSPPAEWDASNGVAGLEVDRLLVVEDDMVLPQPYADVVERTPVPLASALAQRNWGE